MMVVLVLQSIYMNQIKEMIYLDLSSIVIYTNTLSFSTLHISPVINLYYDIDCLMYPSIA
jgi:hypothetical protein